MVSASNSKLLERVPLAIRLGALVTIPLLVIAVEATSRLSGLGADDAAAESFSEQVDDVAAIERAIRALQIERDLSVQFL